MRPTRGLRSIAPAPERAGEARAATVDRPVGPLATLTLPGQPPRTLALKVRPTSELLAEELRRLDPDKMYAVVLRRTSTPSAAGPAKEGVRRV